MYTYKMGDHVQFTVFVVVMLLGCCLTKLQKTHTAHSILLKRKLCDVALENYIYAMKIEQQQQSSSGKLGSFSMK